jgi:hypothetical protein
MPQSATESKRRSRRRETVRKNQARSAASRYTVGLTHSLADQVERYAQAVDTSMSKAIAALVRIGLESQESRKRDFFKKLKENLANDDPNELDRLVDEFRSMILGH